MNFVREIVSGQKVRFNDGQYNLDLTYITNRVIAMSFPASGFESSYRNNIDDVSKFLYEHHDNQYMIFNLSNRKYNYEKLGNRIREFAWEDHHSPPIDMLFDVCKQVDDFLQQEINNVAIIHCQAGKGRTGTLICCYLIYCGRCQTPNEARFYYSKKRFNKAKSGVTQPSQVRYIGYFHQIFQQQDYSSERKILDSITLIGPPPKMSTTSKGCRPYVDIYFVRTKQRIYSGRKEKDNLSEEYLPKQDQFKIKIGNSDLVVYGDILIKCYHSGTIQNKFIFRFAFNTCMIDETNELKFDLSNLDPDSNYKDKKFSQDFQVKLNFKSVCQFCTNRQKFSEKCKECQQKMHEEEASWDLVYKVMDIYPKYQISDSRILLFGDPDYDDFDELLEKQNSMQNQMEESAGESDDASEGEIEEEKKQV